MFAAIACPLSHIHVHVVLIVTYCSCCDRRDMGVGLDNWEQVAEMRAACRELKFGDEEGRENEIWMPVNRYRNQY